MWVMFFIVCFISIEIKPNSDEFWIIRLIVFPVALYATYKHHKYGSKRVNKIDWGKFLFPMVALLYNPCLPLYAHYEHFFIYNLSVFFLFGWFVTDIINNNFHPPLTQKPFDLKGDN